MPTLQGQSAIVTGGSRGIGRAIAKELAREGASVVVNYRSRREDAEAVVCEIRAQGGTAECCPGDVATETDMRALVAYAASTFGRLDILVCNAGIVRDQLLGAMRLEDWEAVMQTNTRGVFLAIREISAAYDVTAIGQHCGAVVDLGGARRARTRELRGIEGRGERDGEIARD